jgi:hypothetical protein
MTNHPITPPLELIYKWARYSGIQSRNDYENLWEQIATQAAQWGADQELEACCEWLAKYRKPILGGDLKYVRRPQPLSLKEEAMSEVASAVAEGSISPERAATIRLALEQLPK